jgi:hypothetical protein
MEHADLSLLAALPVQSDRDIATSHVTPDTDRDPPASGGGASQALPTSWLASIPLKALEVHVAPRSSTLGWGCSVSPNPPSTPESR